MSNNSLQPTSAPMEFSKLLSFVEEEQEDGNHHSASKEQVDAFTNTPIFTVAVDKFISAGLRIPSSPSFGTASGGSSTFHTSMSSLEGQDSKLIPQYGLIGIRQDPADAQAPVEDRLVLANMNMPWSAFICGSQGAGKSHTLSILLENALVPDNAAGELPHPLAGIVMHYDKFSNYNTTQICEAAYLCSSGIPVTVLVSPSNIWTMKRLYSNLPGLKPGVPKPKVVPLYLEENQLDISRILKLMAIDTTAEHIPLYMEVVMNIVREMAMEGPASGFTYSKFRERLKEVRWVRGQTGPLDLRLKLLDIIMAPSSTTKTSKPASSKENIWSFEPGSLTIVDLSDPFFNSDEACTLFSICLSIFLEDRDKCGRVVVLDEAHKVGKWTYP